MSSLNAGLELENEELFEEPEAGQLPDLEADVKLITSFEHRFEDLGRLADDIQRSGGMNQNFAMEAERLSPGFLSEQVPLGYYSKDTSATRLKVSLEEISKGMWALIAAGIAAALALVYKLIKWFTGRGDDGESTGGGSSGVSSGHEHASATADELQHIMKTAGKDKTEDGDSLHNVAGDLAIRRDTHIYKFLREQNEAVSEILSGKQLQHEVVTAAKDFNRCIGLFRGKFVAFSKAMAEDMSSDEATINNQTKMAVHTLMQPIVVNWTPKLKGNIQDVAAEFDNEFKTKVAQPHKLGDNYDTVLLELARGLQDQGIIGALHVGVDWDGELVAFKDILEASQKKYGQHDEKSLGDNLSLEMAQHLRNCMAFLIKEVAAMTRAFGVVYEASKLMQKLARDAVGVQEELVKELEVRAKTSGHELPDSVKELKAKLAEMKKKPEKK